MSKTKSFREIQAEQERQVESKSKLLAAFHKRKSNGPDDNMERLMQYQLPKVTNAPYQFNDVSGVYRCISPGCQRYQTYLGVCSIHLCERKDCSNGRILQEYENRSNKMCYDCTMRHDLDCLFLGCPFKQSLCHKHIEYKCMVCSNKVVAPKHLLYPACHEHRCRIDDCFTARLKCKKHRCVSDDCNACFNKKEPVLKNLCGQQGCDEVALIALVPSGVIELDGLAIILAQFSRSLVKIIADYGLFEPGACFYHKCGLCDTRASANGPCLTCTRRTCLSVGCSSIVYENTDRCYKHQETKCVNSECTNVVRGQPLVISRMEKFSFGLVSGKIQFSRIKASCPEHSCQHPWGCSLPVLYGSACFKHMTTRCSYGQLPDSDSIHDGHPCNALSFNSDRASWCKDHKCQKDDCWRPIHHIKTSFCVFHVVL